MYPRRTTTWDRWATIPASLPSITSQKEMVHPVSHNNYYRNVPRLAHLKPINVIPLGGMFGNSQKQTPRGRVPTSIYAVVDSSRRASQKLINQLKKKWNRYIHVIIHMILQGVYLWKKYIYNIYIHGWMIIPKKKSIHGGWLNLEHRGRRKSECCIGIHGSYPKKKKTHTAV